MKLTTTCFLILALGLIAPVAKAATVSTQLILLDQFDVELPHTGTTYSIAPGTQFRVMLQGRVNNPNFTDTFRAGTTLDNKPLGIELIAGDLSTSGLNIVNPDGAPPAFPGNPPTWANFVEYIGTGTPGFVNLNDVDNDGDLDPATTGTANPSLALTSPVQLPFVQAGAFGWANLFEGTYTAFNPGTTQLTFFPSNVNIYIDPAAANNALAVESSFATIIGAGTALTIQVIPEPSTVALAGVSLVGLVSAMRRKTVSLKSSNIVS
jgi:hypothetical protein